MAGVARGQTPSSARPRSRGSSGARRSRPWSADGVGLVAALDDPLLLGGSVSLWPRQRDLLRDVERYWGNVWALGRRSGKSMMAAAALCWDALLRPDLAALLQPGERRYSVVVATKQEQAQIVLRAARSLLEASPALRQSIETVTENEILLEGWRCDRCLRLLVARRPWLPDLDARARRGRPFPRHGGKRLRRLRPSGTRAEPGPVRRPVPPDLSSSPNGADGLFADWWHRAQTVRSPGRSRIASARPR